MGPPSPRSPAATATTTIPSRRGRRPSRSNRMWQPDQIPLYRAADVARRFAAGEIAILDVRDPDEWDAGHIPGAHWIPLDQIEDRFDELDRAREWVCVCHLG